MDKSAALLLALAAMFLWGSWANTLLLSRIRFELYFLDYILGHLLAGCVLLQDAAPSLQVAAEDPSGAVVFMISALAGLLFALGSLLAVASIDLAGMALPTIVLLGVEMALGVPFLLLVEGWGSAQHMILAFAGVIAVLAATLLDGWCHWSLQKDCTPEEQESQPLCFGFTSSQFSSLSFWSFRATSVAAGSFARSLNSTAVTFLTHGSALPVSSVGSQQVLTAASGTIRAHKQGHLGLSFAAMGGLCFAIWPCISSCVEGQTQWGNAFTTQLNASAFFFIYALGALLAALLLLPPLCRWPLHSGVSLNFWANYMELRAWNHFLGLSGGFAHGCGSLLSLQAGRVLGNAVAMSITRCQPLVCATWGVLIWGELQGAGTKTSCLFASMLLAFTAAVVLFLIAGLDG
ncbi:UPS1 [Symbiodinium pilosum]|uniref:UPS1 protein n=1 Tax=Symbiodinium pilosum TaxID=2952 RepID=A0A812P8B7_SYMPI|nr:UPS1 [Symbiodinium pilosum]